MSDATEGLMDAAEALRTEVEFMGEPYRFEGEDEPDMPAALARYLAAHERFLAAVRASEVA